MRSGELSVIIKSDGVQHGTTMYGLRNQVLVNTLLCSDLSILPPSL